ncbi:hypothetical protein Salat_1085100 [Sesamum alatum]|uniref:Tf2-1-like SH3-like domain-containing protein n=1 Tax=Sesamum alatum TaxID=300844 RepID=A0AAE1YP94_9LAMI|nr:hypothetical protein Salat_1085100 [Sesamum alatum]
MDSYHKLALRYFGPFQILQKVGMVACRLELPEETRVHPVFHVSQLKRKIGSIPCTPHLPISFTAHRHIVLDPEAIWIIGLVNGTTSQSLKCWCEQFFEIDETPTDAKVKSAAVHFEGKALQWHQVYMKTRVTREIPHWEEYVRALNDRFGTFLYEDLMSELLRPRGLKYEIAIPVRMVKPKSLQEAMNLARLQDRVLQAGYRKPISFPPLRQPATPQKFEGISTKISLLHQVRRKVIRALMVSVVDNKE